MPKPGEQLDATDYLLRDFARALIATALHVHDDVAASRLPRTPKRQCGQEKSRVRGTVAARPDVVSSVPHNDSGAAPFAPADPVVPNP